MTIQYLEPLNRAWMRMQLILFQPFDAGKWLVLGFAAWLAGLADGGGGNSRVFGADFNDFPTRHSIATTVEHSVDQFLEHALLIPLIVFAGLLLITLILGVLWISSRAKFIFLDDVAHNRAAIVDPWSRFAGLGNSLFLWRVGFGLALMLSVAIIMFLFIVPSAGFSLGRGLRELSLAALGFAGVLTLVIGIFAAYVSLFLESFIVPIMYKYNLPATKAWSYFLPWLKSQAIHFLLYGLYVLTLHILFGIFFALACLLTCCILALPYVGTVLLLPIIVTYRLLSLEFLAQFHEDFNILPTVVEDAIYTSVTGDDQG